MKKYINKSINQGGFALVATIAILALVVMVALAMVSLATSTTTTETHTRALDEARANARLALAEAISTLQRTTGPDTRVTASAKILVSGDPEDIESQNPDHPISLSDDEVGNFTGAWKSWEGTDHDNGEDDFSTVGLPLPAADNDGVLNLLYPRKYEAADTSGEGSDARFIQWLVSDAGTGDLFDPMNPPSFLESDNTVPLISEGSVGENVNSQIHVIPKKIGENGQSAWVIDGQNQKALLRDSDPDLTVVGSSYAGSVYGGAHQNVFDGTHTAEELESFFTHKSYELSNVFGPDFGKENFYNITGFSSGLLTNVATGGFRNDLSLFSEQWAAGNLPEYQTGFPAFGIKPGQQFMARQANTSTWFGTQGELIYPWGNSAKAHPLTSVSWDFFVDWATKYKDDAILTSVPERLSIKTASEKLTEYQLSPVLARQDFIYSFFAEEAEDDQIMLKVIFNPYVVFWNPYTVPLEVTDGYQLGNNERITPISIDFDVVDSEGEMEREVTNLATRDFRRLLADGETYNGYRRNSGYTYRVHVQEEGDGGATWAPGEARIFTPREGTDSLNFFPGVRVNPDAFVFEVGTFDKDSTITNLQIAADEVNVIGGNNGDLRRGPGMALQITQFGHPSLDDIHWHNVIQTEIHRANVAMYFDRDVNLQGRAASDLTLESLTAGPVKFVSSTYAIRAADDLTPNYDNPTTKGYVLNDPTSPMVRTFWALKGGTNHQGNTIRPNQAYNRFTRRNRFEDVPYDFLFVPIGSDTDPVVPQGTSSSSETFIGPSYSSTHGLTRFPIKDIPKRPITSLGDLQSLPINFLSQYPPRVADPLTNSHASPLLPPGVVVIRDRLESALETVDQIERYIVDHSYLSNHLFFDDWFATSIASELSTTAFATEVTTPEDVLKEFLTGQRLLPNQYYRPINIFREEQIENIFEDEDIWREIASMIRVEGMFNINSVSVDAWRAVLSNSMGNPISKFSFEGSGPMQFSVDTSADNDEAVYTRTNTVFDTSSESGLVEYLNPEPLSETHIDLLAEKIVEQIKLRGPFLSLSEFVNRQLRPRDESDNSIRGLSTLTHEETLARAGAIETAILEMSELEDPAQNPNAALAFSPISQQTLLGVESPFILADGVAPGDVARGAPGSTSVQYLVPEFPEAGKGSTSYGFPGWLRQGDVIRSLAPILTARDDTFRIRAYGSAVDTTGQTVEVWCEAIVTRTAEYVNSGDNTSVLAPNTLPSEINQQFGRKYEVVSFKWLNSDEV